MNLEKFSQTLEDLIEQNRDTFEKNGKVPKGKKLSRNYIAKKVLGVSGTWFSSIVNGEKEPSDDIVLKLAEFFEVDETYMFYLLGRVHPDDLNKFKENYLENLKKKYTS